MVEVFTVGFPRSGNTWIGYLLCAMLDAPLQNPGEKIIETQWARKIDNQYIVRKTHWRRHEVMPNGCLGAPIKTVWIYRDPRDLVVSRKYYFHFGSIRAMIEDMASAQHPRPFRDFILEWYNDSPTFRLSYEQLHTEPIEVLTSLYAVITGEVPLEGKVEDAIAMHEFRLHKPNNPHAMRKGIVGDWRNHFTREDAELLEHHYGDIIRLLGYEKDDSWVLTV